MSICGTDHLFVPFFHPILEGHAAGGVVCFASTSSLESDGARVVPWAKALIPEARIIAAMVRYFFMRVNP